MYLYKYIHIYTYRYTERHTQTHAHPTVRTHINKYIWLGLLVKYKQNFNFFLWKEHKWYYGDVPGISLTLFCHLQSTINCVLVLITGPGQRGMWQSSKCGPRVEKLSVYSGNTSQWLREIMTWACSSGELSRQFSHGPKDSVVHLLGEEDQGRLPGGGGS